MTLLPPACFVGPLGPLVNALRHAKRIAPNKTAVPILTCAMLRKDNNGAVVLAVTDLDCEFEFTLPGAVLVKPVVLSIAALLAGLDGEDPAATVRIVLRQEDGEDDPVADVTVGDFTFTLTAYPTEDFPVFPSPISMAPGGGFSISGGALYPALTAVKAAISTEETRYYLNGVYIHAAPETEHGAKTLRMVSTDGHKLMSVTFPDQEWRGPGLILSRITLDYLLPLVKAAGDAPIHVWSYGETRIHIGGPGWLVRTKVIDGTFPDYTRVIPRFLPDTVMAESDAIIAACKKLTKLSPARATIVAVDPGDNSISLRGSDAVRSARVSVPFSPTAAPVDPVGINAAYLSAIAAHMGDAMSLSITTPADPIRIEPVTQPDGFDLLAIVMPVRI
jgi:DNA polymerase III subunit beta